MSKIPTTPLEQIIHQALRDIASKCEVDVDLVAEIVEEFNKIMSEKVKPSHTFSLN